MKAVLKVQEPSGVAFLVFGTSLDGFGTIPVKVKHCYCDNFAHYIE